MSANSNYRISSGEMLSLNTVLFLGLLVQAYLYYGYCLGRRGLLPIILSVLILAAVLAVYTLIRAHHKADVRNHILSCLFVLFLGPLGSFIALTSNTASVVFSRKFRGNFSDWIFNRLLAADLHERDSDRIYKRIISGREDIADNIDTEPLIDIMELGSTRQKQAALVKVVKHFRPHLAPVLQMGLNDPDNAIRVQTAAALAKLQDDFHKEYTCYEQKIRGEAVSGEELVRFAKICEKYSNSGLMNAGGKAAALKESITLFEHAVNASPDNLELKVSLIRMHMINVDRDKVNELLTEVLPHVQNPKPDIGDTLMELLFKMNRFPEIRRNARKWKLQYRDNPENTISEKIEFWSGRPVSLNPES